MIFIQDRFQHNTKLEDSIFSIVEDKNKNEINIKPLADFDWDKAFLFEPYTTQGSIDKQLGIHFKDPSNMDMRDDIYLMIFLNEGKVIQYAEIKRQYADFFIGSKEYLTPSDATIKIKRY